MSKVYEVTSYADYSGAHIDIGTKDQNGENFFTAGFSVGGRFNTLGRSFYRMDHRSLFTRPGVDARAMSCSLSEYRDYVRTKNILTPTSRFRAPPRSPPSAATSPGATTSRWDARR